MKKLTGERDVRERGEGGRRGEREREVESERKAAAAEWTERDT